MLVLSYPSHPPHHSYIPFALTCLVLYIPHLTFPSLDHIRFAHTTPYCALLLGTFIYFLHSFITHSHSFLSLSNTHTYAHTHTLSLFWFAPQYLTFYPLSHYRFHSPSLPHVYYFLLRLLDFDVWIDRSTLYMHTHTHTHTLSLSLSP